MKRSVSALLRFSTLCMLMSIALHPAPAHALDCPAGGREATAADIAVMGPVVRGRCVDASTIAKLKPDETYAAIQYLSTKMCAGKQFGFPPGFNEKSVDPKEWYKVKEGYVYFNYTTQTDGRSGTNPGVLRCFENFFKQAEKQGYQPCISAGLRSPAHQRASCLDTANSVVCGRQVSCTTDLNWYAVCPHVKGIAFDINDMSCGSGTCPRTYQLLEAARASNLFSKVGAGSADPWHVEAAGCATGGLSAPAPFPAATTPTPAPSRPAVPTNILADATRALLGTGTECQQLGTQCQGTPVNPQACMAYAQRCQGQTQQQGLLQGLQNAFTQLAQQQSGTAPAATPTVVTPPITTPLPIDIITLPTTTPGTTTPATSTRPLSPTVVTELNNTQIRLVPPAPPEDPTAIQPTTITPLHQDSVTPTFGPESDMHTRPLASGTAQSVLALLRDARAILEGLLTYLTPFSRTANLRSSEKDTPAQTAVTDEDTALWYDERFIQYMETQPGFYLGN